MTDSLNCRIQIFSADGKFISQFGSSGDTSGHFGRPKGVAADSFGHIYVADAIFDNVQIFDATGRLLLNFGQSGDGRGRIRPAQRRRHRAGQHDLHRRWLTTIACRFSNTSAANENFSKIYFRFDVSAVAGGLVAPKRAKADSVVNSVHNLSVNGPGTIKASSEKDACVFCHTVHRASGVTPLWNHSMSGETNYIVYSSQRMTDLNIVIPQPNGSSRLCLSCHDGTVALGNVSSRTTPIAMQGGATMMPAGDPNNLGTDLSGDHPISFIYDSALASRDSEIKDPSQLTGPVKLDKQSQLQCTACHNPHDDQYRKFSRDGQHRLGVVPCLPSAGFVERFRARDFRRPSCRRR